jgi:hypothetical protein
MLLGAPLSDRQEAKKCGELLCSNRILALVRLALKFSPSLHHFQQAWRNDSRSPKLVVILHPKSPIKGSVLDRFADVLGVMASDPARSATARETFKMRS